MKEGLLGGTLVVFTEKRVQGGPYAKRQGMIEPVFGHTKFNRRCDRFQRRGRAACRSESRLITTTHNHVKLWRHTAAPAPA